MKYFEDFELGERAAGEDEYLVTREEILEFGRRWDPASFHVDEEAAKESVYGGLIAPGAYLMAIQTWLIHRHEDRTGDRAVAIGRVGTEVKFPNPVRPGDRISFELECVGKRESRGRPDRGVITCAVTLRNQRGEDVLKLKNVFLVSRRPE